MTNHPHVTQLRAEVALAIGFLTADDSIAVRVTELIDRYARALVVQEAKKKHQELFHLSFEAHCLSPIAQSLGQAKDPRYVSIMERLAKAFPHPVHTYETPPPEGTDS